MYHLSEQNKKIDPRFQSKWLDEVSWIVYFEIKKDAFCKFCNIFSKAGKAQNQSLEQLLFIKYSNWKKN